MRDILSKTLCLSIGITCFCGITRADEKQLSTKNPAKLEIAFVADAAVPTVSFTAVNIGEAPIHRGDLMVNTNGIFAFREDGVGFAAHTIADSFGARKEVPMIKPGESATWEITLENLFDRLRIENAGTYRMYWEFYTGDEIRSKPITLIRKADKPEADRIVPERVGSLRSPKGTAKTFYGALGGNISDLMHSISMDPNDRGEKETQHALFIEALGAQQFRSAAINKFSAQTVGDWKPDDLDQVMRDMDNAKVVLSDDLNHADLVVNPKWTLHFTRQRFDHWQIDISNFIQDGLPYQQIGIRANIMMKMAEEIRLGKYATFKEANGELVRRFDEASGAGAKVDPNPSRKPQEEKKKVTPAKQPSNFKF